MVKGKHSKILLDMIYGIDCCANNAKIDVWSYHNGLTRNVNTCQQHESQGDTDWG